MLRVIGQHTMNNELSPFFSCDFVKDHKVGGWEALRGIRIGEIQSNYIV